MSWRRIDDGFEDHPKILDLIDMAGYEAYYRLNKMHGYAARQKTNGHVPRSALRELGVTPKMLNAMITVGLIDETNDGLDIHDWKEYNPPDPTAASRMRRHRQRKTTVTEGVTEPSRDRNNDRNADRNDGVTEPSLARTRALAGARVPSPSPLSNDVLSPPNGQEPADATTERETTDELQTLLTRIGIPLPQQAQYRSDTTRAIRTAHAVLADPTVKKPAAYFLKCWATGVTPAEAEHVDTRPPLALYDQLAAWIRNAGHHDTEHGVTEEIRRRETSRGEQLTDEQRLELHELWLELQTATGAGPEPDTDPDPTTPTPTFSLRSIDAAPGSDATAGAAA